MQQSTIMIFQCIGVFFIVAVLYYYVNKRLQYQQLAIENLQSQIMEQYRTMEQHDVMLRQILGPHSFPSIPPVSRPNYQPPSQKPIPVENKTEPVIPNIAPMMSSLMGVLGSFNTPSLNPIQEYEKKKEEEKSRLIQESEINEELEQELKELEPAKEIVEGRIPKMQEVDSS